MPKRQATTKKPKAPAKKRVKRGATLTEALPETVARAELPAPKSPDIVIIKESKKLKIDQDVQILNSPVKRSINKALSPKPTKEQSQIVAFGSKIKQSQICRIYAGAGTGKTTTLTLLTHKLLTSGKSVLYLVYNIAAQKEAMERFPINANFQCMTIHAAVLQYMTKPGNLEFVPQDDNILRAAILREFNDSITFHVNGFQQKFRPAAKLASLYDQVAFWVFKTLESWYRSANPIEKLADTWSTYYPCKLKHQETFGCEANNFYVQTAVKVWQMMWKGKLPITHDAYLKYAQLGNLNIPKFTTVLVDEVQDASEAQLDLFVKQQASAAKSVFVVGDAVQSIYFFRGARPKNIKSILPLKRSGDGSNQSTNFGLTQTFRFGPNIAAIANLFLFVKQNSPQIADFTPYRLQGLGKDQGEILGPDGSLEYPFTVIGRSNSLIIQRAIEILVQDPEAKIAMNDKSGSKFSTTCKKVLDVFALSQGKRPPSSSEFSRYSSYQDFTHEVEMKEMGEYLVLIGLVSKLGDDLPDKIALFRENVLKKSTGINDCQILLTTAHGAKGLEYDNVEILDDFIDLPVRTAQASSSNFTKASAVKKAEKEFSLNGWGDDLNLWYVAATRAKKTLKLPAKFWVLVRFIARCMGASKKELSDSNLTLKDPWSGSAKDTFLDMNEVKLCRNLFQKLEKETLDFLLSLVEKFGYGTEQGFVSSVDDDECD